MTILDEIAAHKRWEVQRLPPGPVTVGALHEARARRKPRDFFGALRRPRRRGMGLIAEVKKASPSAGIIKPDFDPVATARAYEACGADCLSVLTDEKYFQGSLADLTAIRAAVSLPLLRKDFVIDERQILEAAEAGADAVLLIVALLSDDRLAHFHALADAAGLTALVEAHTADELDRALRCGARLIGVNNRDLRTFTVDLATTEALADRLRLSGWDPKDAAGPLLVAESGLKNAGDVARVAHAGAQAILVGESLMRSDDRGAQAAALLGGVPTALEPAERFDVVDAEDRVIGVETRFEVHRLGLRHRATHLLIYNRRGELFLQQRSLEKDNFPGVWDSSASGHLDAGETYDACVVREAREELGVSLTAPPAPLLKLPATPETGMEFCQVYRCRHEGPFSFQAAEVRGGGWFTEEAIAAWMTSRPDDFAGGFRAIWRTLADRPDLASIVE